MCCDPWPESSDASHSGSSASGSHPDSSGSNSTHSDASGSGSNHPDTSHSGSGESHSDNSKPKPDNDSDGALGVVMFVVFVLCFFL